LLPTPTSRDGKGVNPHRGGSADLPGALLPTPSASDGAGGKTSRSGDRIGELLLGGVARTLLPTPNAADGARGQDLARADRDGSGGDDLVTLAVKATRDAAWQKYRPAIRRWEQLTRPAPPPTEPNKNGNPRLNPAFSEWMMGWPAGWVTDLVLPMTDPRPDKISRNDALRIIGNGVVVWQAVAALQHLLSVVERAA